MRDQIDSGFVVLVENNRGVDRQQQPSHTHVETRFVSFIPARKLSSNAGSPKNLKSHKSLLVQRP